MTLKVHLDSYDISQPTAALANLHLSFKLTDEELKTVFPHLYTNRLYLTDGVEVDELKERIKQLEEMLVD